MCTNIKRKINVLFAELKLSFLLFVIFFAISILLVIVYFAFSKSYMVKLGGIICLADYINLINGNYFFSTVIIPFTVFINLNVSESGNGYIYLLKFKSKKHIVLHDFAKIFFSSLLLSAFIMLACYAIGGLFTNIAINWNATGSYSYVSSGMTLNISFIYMLGSTFVFLIGKILLLSFLAYLINIFIKKIYAFLIVVALSVTNIITWIVSCTETALQLSSKTIFSYSHIIMVSAFNLALYFVILYLSFIFYRKKDLLDE